MDEKTPHSKFKAPHENYVYGMLMLDDRETGSVDQDDGKVYQCQEERCARFKPHCHKRRPYLVWLRNR